MILILFITSNSSIMHSDGQMEEEIARLRTLSQQL